MSEIDGSYLVAKSLKDEGVEKLFYLMGGPNYEIVNNSQDFGIDVYDFRHEQVAAMAAHSYTRVTRKTGVTTSASGPGTLNLLTGQYNAFVDCAPMLTVGGAGPSSDFGKGGFQEIDHLSIFKPISKEVMRPNDPLLYPESISKAFDIARNGRPGPVYIDCNEDILYKKVDRDHIPEYSRSKLNNNISIDIDQIKTICKYISNSNNPIIIAGGGAWWSNSENELSEFVDNLGIPFYTTPISRGLLPDDHKFSFPGARSTAFRECDLVLVLGTRLNWVMTFGKRIANNAKIIQIDIHAPEIGNNREVDIGIHGDVKKFLEEMNNRIGDIKNKSNNWEKWRNYLSGVDQERKIKVSDLENSTQLPIHPLRLCKDLREFMDRDAILSVDGNEILHYGRQSLPTFYPGHRINSGPTGCMGVGLPYAIGAKIAKPDKQVISLHGDGSLGMNIQDFDTAVRFSLPMIIVVSNNEGWTARTEGIRKPGRELGFTRFDLIAEALGGYGELVEDPKEILPALERANKSGVPSIINVHTDPTARALSKFVGSKME